jgi:hypothetical protein
VATTPLLLPDANSNHVALARAHEDLQAAVEAGKISEGEMKQHLEAIHRAMIEQQHAVELHRVDAVRQLHDMDAVSRELKTVESLRALTAAQAVRTAQDLTQLRDIERAEVEERAHSDMRGRAFATEKAARELDMVKARVTDDPRAIELEPERDLVMQEYELQQKEIRAAVAVGKMSPEEADRKIEWMKRSMDERKDRTENEGLTNEQYAIVAKHIKKLVAEGLLSKQDYERVMVELRESLLGR